MSSVQGARNYMVIGEINQITRQASLSSRAAQRADPAGAQAKIAVRAVDPIGLRQRPASDNHADKIGRNRDDAPRKVLIRRHSAFNNEALLEPNVGAVLQKSDGSTMTGVVLPSNPWSRRALIGAGVGALVGRPRLLHSATNNLVIRRRETVTVTDRGASVAGLAAALHEVDMHGGGIVRLASGPIRLRVSDLLASGPMMISGSTVIEGEGVPLIVTGDGVAPPLFVARDASAIRLRNLVATGNGRALADTRSGNFALFEMTGAAGAVVEDVALENIALSGFAGERWVQFLQRAPGGAMSGLRIDDLRAGAGRSVAPDAIGVSAAVVWVHGLGGTIQDVVVRRLNVDASGIKQGCALVHKVRNATIDSAVITNAGARGARDNAGGYAIMIYGDRDEISDIAILTPVIRNPRSAGIYLRGATRVRIEGAVIEGQTDRVATDLPKGAIVLNGCSAIRITGGKLSANVTDISVADSGVTTLDLDVEGVRAAGSGTSVLLAISPGRGAITGVRFTNCILSGRERVFRVMNEQVPGRFYNDVWLRGGTYSSGTAANVIEFTQGAITDATGYRIENLTVAASQVGIMATGMQGSLTLRGTTIDGLGRMDYGIVADDCPRLDWNGVAFRGVEPGFAYTARSLRRRAGGSIRGLTIAIGRTTATLGSVPIS